MPLGVAGLPEDHRPPAPGLPGPGASTREVIHPEDRQRWDEHLEQLGPDDGGHDELRISTSPARATPCTSATSAAALPALVAKRLGRRGSNRDITEQYRHEQELRAGPAKQADAGNRAKSEFLANMSHEIRTPLNGITGMLHVLKLTSLSQEQKKYVALALNSLSRLTRLLSDILDRCCR